LDFSNNADVCFSNQVELAEQHTKWQCWH